MKRVLEDPTARLSLPVADLIAETGQAKLHRFIEDKIRAQRPSMLAYTIKVIGAALIPGGAGLGAVVGENLTQRYDYHSQFREYLQLSDRFTVSRAVIALPENERGVFTAKAACIAARTITPYQWRSFLCRMIWADGTCLLEPDADIATLPAITVVRAMLHEFFGKAYDKHSAFIEAEARKAALAAREHNAPIAVPLLSRAIDGGARWMTTDDLQTSRYYSAEPKPQSLILGYTEDGDAPVVFSGNESLITIGGPGSGKSQCQVIPNLLRYRGSAIILDVKGELWDATAAWRQKSFGPVYRFAPTDATQNTHRYNPFDFIARDPASAADQATVFSYQIVVDNPNLNDPYWENKGRDMMWAFAMMIALKASPDRRNIKSLAELMSIPMDKAPDSDINRLCDAMRETARTTGISDLESAANALAAGIGSPRLESVLDNGRRHLSIFTRSPRIESTIGGSDWRPEWFRSRPGSTLYICVPPAELKSYAPIIRVMLIQHARNLMRQQARQGELPITFFLDEMPQLGNFESILEMQDVGRGSGLRLWMFAQYLAQLEHAFGKKYKGVVESCRARNFMQPDLDLVELIQPGLGEVKNPFTGERNRLAEDRELMGRAFDDKVILTTRGDHPMKLNKKFAWQTDMDKMMHPPRVR